MIESLLFKRARSAAMGEGRQDVGNDISGRWDEDDVMLFFWATTALERHAQRKQELTVYVEDWRAAVVYYNECAPVLQKWSEVRGLSSHQPLLSKF